MRGVLASCSRSLAAKPAAAGAAAGVKLAANHQPPAGGNGVYHSAGGCRHHAGCEEHFLWRPCAIAKTASCSTAFHAAPGA